MINIFEFFSKNKNDNRNNSSSNVTRHNDDPSQILGVDKYNAWQVVAKLRNLNDTYHYRYQEYDNMESDVVIQSALELYADDSTQLDTNIGKIVKVTAKKDKQLESDLSTFLYDIIHIDNRIWQWSYDLAKYGDFYLKIYTDEDDFFDNISSVNKNKNLDEILNNEDNTSSDDAFFRIEEVEDPSNLMDLWYKGDRIAFAEEITRENDSINNSSEERIDLELRDKNSYVHFFFKKSSKTDKLEIPITGQYEQNQEGTNVRQKVKKFSVVRGHSMIEGVRPIYRILQLLEDSLLAAKIAKAEFVRVYNIEVGDDTPNRTTETINRVKNLFDTRASYDRVSGRYKAKKEYRPIGDPVFNPVRNGKGSITHEDIGGEFEVKNLVDVDYFNNKLFAGLKIPKAYLGFEDSLPGGLGDNTLIRLDIRYSRSVKRLQTALINGIKDLCLAWCKANDRKISSSDFEVSLVSPSSSEELSRLSELNLRVDTIDKIVGSIQSSVGDYINMPKVVALLYKNYLNYPELQDDLLKEIESGIANYELKIEAEKSSNDNIINGDEGIDEQ